jgi:hypothetical protein
MLNAYSKYKGEYQTQDHSLVAATPLKTADLIRRHVGIMC